MIPLLSLIDTYQRVVSMTLKQFLFFLNNHILKVGVSSIFALLILTDHSVLLLISAVKCVISKSFNRLLKQIQSVKDRSDIVELGIFNYHHLIILVLLSQINLLILYGRGSYPGTLGIY